MKRARKTTGVAAQRSLQKTFRDLARARPDANETTSSIGSVIREKLLTLSLKAAGGDLAALSEYFRLTVAAVGEWSSLTKANFEAARELARTSSTWPVAIGIHPDRSDLWLKLKQLELGSGLPIRIPNPGRPWKASGANLHILLALGRLNHVRTPGFLPGTALENWQRSAIALPALSPDSAKDWFSVLWEMILASHAGHPEYNAALCRLGRHRENVSIKKHQQKKVTPRTADANIRDGIRESLRLAFYRIVKTSPTIDGMK